MNISLSGLQSTVNKLRETGGEIAKEVDAEIGAGVVNMDASAKALAGKSVDNGLLRGAIIGRRVQFLTWELVAQKDYAAYVEFGTGTLVDVPKGLESYAIQFKGKGIRQVNLPARPYFFPSVRKYQPEIVKNIIKILREKR